MLVGGLEKLSLIDYPGYLAAVIFVKGCNFGCKFCYNPMLVLSCGKIKDIERGREEGHSHQVKEEQSPLLDEGDLFQFLKRRVGKLEAVVITGGEPTIYNDLPEFINKIKELGFLVKLDTNGTNPEMLAELIEKKLIDYIAMDLKADQGNYAKAAGAKVDFGKIMKSVKIIMGSGLPYEFRTTCVPGFLDEEILENMGKIISGADKWYLQKFKSDTKLVDKDLMDREPFSLEEMKKFAQIGKKYVRNCQVRGGD